MDHASSIISTMDNLKQQIISAPPSPGVYFFKNNKNRIIYIGKALNLKNRLTSYLHNSDLKTRMLMSQAVGVEVVSTGSDVEALTLEESLIKLNKPKYNVRLKDDKKFPYLKVTVKDDFPRIYTTRNLKPDGSALFGPYTSAKSLRQTINGVVRIFGLRTCKMALPGPRLKRACLKFYIKRCTGPCISAISKEAYRRLVDEVLLFLAGKSDRLETQIENEMWAAARKENYEAARHLRDQLLAIRQIRQRQQVVSSDSVDRDVIALMRAANLAVVCLFRIRENKLTSREIYRLTADPSSPTSEIMSAFMRSIYLHQTYLPAEIVVSVPPDDLATFVHWFQKKKVAVDFVLNPRHDRKVLLRWAERNAEIELAQRLAAQPIPRELQELAHLLKLEAPPRWIEAFDVSNIMGDSAVGASVSFKNGRPDKNSYRRFKIRRVEGQNDFAMIQEIVSRRITQFDIEKPDLLLIDGGKGQLTSALAALSEQHIKIPVAAFAKRSDQLYFIDGRIISIPPSQGAAFGLLRRIRNESHRFAVTYHRKVRSKKTRQSILDTIAGIGHKKKVALLRYFGSIERLRRSSQEEICRVKGIDKKLAEKIYIALHT